MGKAKFKLKPVARPMATKQKKIERNNSRAIRIILILTLLNTGRVVYNNKDKLTEMCSEVKQKVQKLYVDLQK
jgi:hypothetical protein